jgi:murein DD-endopeptidase MepM/ murein hydrolase activator NlpD
VFGRRKEPHTIIIANGDSIRHFTIRPWMTALVGSVLASMAIGYLLATSYLVLRDDLFGASAAQHARMQQAYEDRISPRRAPLDRITSRQLLDQQIVESKVSELLARQSQLTQRHGRIGPILDRVTGHTAELPSSAPLPADRPDMHAQLDVAQPLVTAQASGFWPRQKPAAPTGHETAADRADLLFVAINKSLRAIETEQIDGIEILAENTFKTADQISQALEVAGLPVDIDLGDDAAGGPLLPIEGSRFEAGVRELDDALGKLEAIKAIAHIMPIHNPVLGRSVSSSFGVRRDPLLRTPAMHSGIDFRAPSGTPVSSTGAGTVVKAGWNGGYGRMVEVDHGHGFTSRYAHMSRISVKEGQTVEKDTVLGEVGTSGRSTGPHLHYEVRHNGEARDPLRFLKAGRKIAELL